MIDTFEMGNALDTIEEVSPLYAKAKGERVHLDDYRKVQLALLFEKAVGKTVADKESWSKAHPDYSRVIQSHGDAVEKEATLYWKLKLAETQIEVWRTIQASRRREAAIL